MNRKNWEVKISLFILVILSSLILTFAMDSSVASEFKVNQFTDFLPYEDGAEDSAIVVDSNGHIIITWEDSRYSYDNIFARIFDNSGAPLTDDFRVDQDLNYTLLASDPSIAIDSNDRFIITWEETMHIDQDSENNDIFARIFDSNGNPLTDEFRIDQDTGVSEAGGPVIATDGNNNFIIAWTDYRNGNGDIFVRRFDTNGASLGNEFRIDQDTGANEAGGSVIATDGNNNFIIAWADNRNGHTDIFARIFDDNEVPLSDEFKVNQFTDFLPYEDGAEDPAIVVDSNGHIIITWEDPRYSYDNIFARIFDNSGNPLTDDFRVDQDINTLVGSDPSIAIDSKDRFIITWEATMNVDQDSENDDVFARIFDSNGNPLVDEFRIDQDTGVSEASGPVIATDGNNNFIIAWTDNRNGHTDIFATIVSNPSPDIKANNSDSSIILGTSEQLDISISIDSGSYSGASADWYLVVNTPSGWQSFNVSQMNYSTSGLSASLQDFGLINLDSIEIFSTSSLSAGTYTYYFAVELNGQLYYDSVVVNVE